MADGSNHPDIYSIDQWYVPLTNGLILWLVRNRSLLSELFSKIGLYKPSITEKTPTIILMYVLSSNTIARLLTITRADWMPEKKTMALMFSHYLSGVTGNS
jgi:hypothetical protein